MRRESGLVPCVLNSSQVFITYINYGISFDELVVEMRGICGFHHNYPFTMKWVDEEGDPCTVNSQMELDEAIRLYEVNKEAELTVHGRTEHSFVRFGIWELLSAIEWKLFHIRSTSISRSTFAPFALTTKYGLIYIHLCI